MNKTNQLNKLSAIRVLYVEDDTETREELQSILELYVAKLYTAKNGLEGLMLYKQYQPDIVVTDIQMPEKNGLAMAADIKAINPEQQIVVLSAYNDVEYLFHALELDISHYITKPISVEHLLNKLAEVFGHMKLAREAKQNRKLLEQYKMLVDEKAIVAKIDAQGTISYVNRHFCELSGYSEAELLGRHYLFCFEDNNQQDLLDDLKKALSENKKWQGILKKRTKGGIIYVVDVTVVAVINVDNEVEEYVALMVDMTEVYDKFERLFLDLQQDLDEHKHYLHEYGRALELGTSLCIIDTDGKIISANKNFSTLLDYRLEEMPGLSLCDLIQDSKDFKDRVLKKVTQQGFSSRVIKITGKEGLQRTLSTVIVALHNQQGEVHSLMGLSHDISESARLSEEIIESQKELIYVLGEVVENRSHETGSHTKRVALISELLALKYGLDKDYAALIKTASPLHDIGNIGLPDEILHKSGKLSDEEFQLIKKHTVLGFQLLNKLDKPLIKMAATIAHEHHEKYDGTGYPAGLSGEHIAIEARIVALADVFDVLSSRRLYKEPWSDEEIIDYMKQNKGLQFDPELVDLFLENIGEILAIRNRLAEQ